jgi:hypothetical protein
VGEAFTVKGRSLYFLLTARVDGRYESGVPAADWHIIFPRDVQIDPNYDFSVELIVPAPNPPGIYRIAVYSRLDIGDVQYWATRWLNVVAEGEPIPPEPPIQPVPAPTPPPTLTAPPGQELPWYMAWLRPFIDWFRVTTDAVVNHFTPIFESVNGRIDQISKSLTAFKVSTDEFLLHPGDLVVDAMLGAMGGRARFSEKIITESEIELVKQSLDPAKFETNEFKDAVAKIRESMTGTPGSLLDFVDATVNVPIKALGAAIREFLIPVGFPTFEDAKERQLKIFALYLDFITLGAIIDTVASVVSITLIRNVAHHIRTVLVAFNAGEMLASVNEPAFDKSVKRSLEYGYNRQFQGEIPATSDLINMVVKEVIPLDDFKNNMRSRGFSEVWGQRIWDAHFIPPTLTDILTAWRRGEITEERADALMILVDLDPRFKAIFDTRKFVDPTLSLARFMFEIGAIDKERVSDIIHRQGFSEPDTEVLTNYTTRFQERLWIRRYVVNLARGFETGAITEADLRAAVADAHFSEGVADWIVKTSELRKKIRGERLRTALLSRKDLMRLFKAGKLTQEEYDAKLAEKGFEEQDRDFIEFLDAGEETA